MKIIPTEIPDVLIIEPDVFNDSRGCFMETYNKERYSEVGINDIFVQDNLSFSSRNVLRGMHFQIKYPQTKLLQVISGEIFDAAIDLRPESETYGQWVGMLLSDENNRQAYIPRGFAHGFCVLSDTARVSYKCSDIYRPGDEGGILWSDPDIGIKWPAANPVVSEKDSKLPILSDCPSNCLPVVNL